MMQESSTKRPQDWAKWGSKNQGLKTGSFAVTYGRTPKVASCAWAPGPLYLSNLSNTCIEWIYVSSSVE